MPKLRKKGFKGLALMGSRGVDPSLPNRGSMTHPLGSRPKGIVALAETWNGRFWPKADGPLSGAECGKADVGSGWCRGSYRPFSAVAMPREHA